MHFMTTAGGLVLLLGVPYFAVFLYQQLWGPGGQMWGGVIGGVMTAFGVFLIYAGVQSERKAQEALAKWPRVQGQIISVQERARSQGWVMTVRWKDPGSRAEYTVSSESFPVHPRYALPDMTIPVALKPGRPEHGLIDLSKLHGVPTPPAPSFSVGEWIGGYLEATRKADGEAWFVFLLLAAFPLAFLVLGALTYSGAVATSNADSSGSIISMTVGALALAVLIWMFAPRDELTLKHLKQHGTRLEAQVLGIDRIAQYRVVTLRLPTNELYTLTVEHEPVGKTLPLWRHRTDPRLWRVEVPDRQAAP